MTNSSGRVADGEQALVNHAPAGHGPSGFDPSRIDAKYVQALERIIRETLWMACRYAHGRRSYAVGMYNDAARQAVHLGVIPGNVETWAIDGDVTAEMSGLSQREFSAAITQWTAPNSIRTHVASAIEARRAATLGAVHESAVAEPDAQGGPA